jgi:hypothetical protein
MSTYRALSLLFTFCFVSFFASFAQQPKFTQSATLVLEKGCGPGLDKDSGLLDNKVSVLGACVTRGATGGHACVKLPGNLKGDQVNIMPSAGVGSGPTVGFKSCSKRAGDDCEIGWSRYEADEYYKDTNTVCGRFKNWSADRDITVRIQVVQK